MRQRHKEHPYKEKEYVHMALRVPTELHAEIIKEQERLCNSGKDLNLKEVTVKLLKLGLNK